METAPDVNDQGVYKERSYIEGKNNHCQAREYIKAISIGDLWDFSLKNDQREEIIKKKHRKSRVNRFTVSADLFRLILHISKVLR